MLVVVPGLLYRWRLCVDCCLLYAVVCCLLVASRLFCVWVKLLCVVCCVCLLFVVYGPLFVFVWRSL